MINPAPAHVTWHYGEWQSTYENLNLPNFQLEQGLPTAFDTVQRNIVVLDDLMAETDGRVTDLFTNKLMSSLEHVRQIPRAERFPEA